MQLAVEGKQSLEVRFAQQVEELFYLPHRCAHSHDLLSCFMSYALCKGWRALLYALLPWKERTAPARHPIDLRLLCRHSMPPQAQRSRERVIEALICKTIPAAGTRRQEHEVKHSIGTQSA
jgi:hypothetical protein